MLKYLLVLSALILFGAAITPGPTPAQGRMPPQAAPTTPAATNPVKPTAASQERAKSLYARNCALCHGDNGNGKTDLAKDMELTLPDWTDPKALDATPDQALFSAIRMGKGKMPPEDESRAKDDEVWNLVIYIRGMSKGH